MTRATVIDTLEDVYKINSDELTPRELAIIGLVTNNITNEEVILLQSHIYRKQSDKTNRNE
jgi:hypothetical protein